MKKNQIDESIQYSHSITNQPAPDKDNEPPKEKPGINDPDNNDPTREDKPPLIISKL